jgi:hypothetical protein
LPTPIADGARRRRADESATRTATEAAAPVGRRFEGLRELYTAMRSNSNQDRRFVYGYIAGITDSESTTTGAPGRAFCLPRYAKLDQLFDITRKWFGDHPEQLHLPAYLVVQWALTDVYACPIAKR